MSLGRPHALIAKELDGRDFPLKLKAKALKVYCLAVLSPCIVAERAFGFVRASKTYCQMSSSFNSSSEYPSVGKSASATSLQTRVTKFAPACSRSALRV
jgi:hypothetical protein